MIRKVTYLYLIAIHLLVATGISYSQYYVTGQSPASIQWHQMHTQNFQIIFSKEVQDEANQLANTLEHAYQYIHKTLDHKPKKISVLLHNYTVQSNGLVAWAPKRMEAFLIPPQDSYAQQWLDQLAVHELRHVVQIDKLNQGITKILYFLFGEHAVGAVAGFIPDWFYEGDAVSTETALTNTGRGRLPSFEKGIKAIELDNSKKYSYNKITLGSYRNYVPNHYQYGYFLTAYAREKYGAMVWDSVVDFVARNPYSVFPAYFGLKKYTGLSKRELYLSAMDYLYRKWKNQVQQLSPTKFRRWNKRNTNDYTNYRYPQYLNDTAIIVEKSGIDQIPEFIILTRSGKETKLHTPGFYSSLSLSCHKQQLIWSEYIPDTRWSMRDFYVVKSYDLNRDKITRMSTRSRYFAPSLSHDASTIVVVEYSLDNKSFLTFLDSQTGDKNNSVPVPGYDIQFPAWNSTDDAVYATAVTPEGKMIIRYHIPSRQWDTILPPGRNNISRPVMYNDHLFFRADYSGIDNIYAIHLPGHKIYQLTSSIYGAYNPTVNADGDKIMYSDYTSKGYNVVEARIEDLLWRPVGQVKKDDNTLAKTISKQEGNQLNTKDIPDSTYQTKPYNKLSHLFRFHSWMPFYFEFESEPSDYVNDPDIFPGITLISQNMLGSAITILGYGYQNNRHLIYNKFIYKGWYPAFEITTGYGGEPQIYSKTITEDEIAFDRFSVSSRLFLPLNLTRNRFIRGIQPSIIHYYSNDHYFNYSTRLNERGIHSFNHRLYAYNYLKTSKRDITPRFGQTLSLTYAHSEFNDNVESAAFMASGRVYLPGLFKHHSIRAEYGYQENLKPFYYSNNLTLPYGYRNVITSVYPETIETYNVEYIFPLFYPDLSFSTFLYIKRFKAALFYGYATLEDFFFAGSDIQYNAQFETMGFEVTTDFFAFQLRTPFVFGVRYIYFPDTESRTIETVFNLNLSNL